MNVVLRSERVFTQGEIRPADIVIHHDLIEDVAPYGSAPESFNLGDKLITPGFVDLHSDAVEKEIEPRPGAAFPVENALVELDKKLAMAGITTMFHAIAFNEESLVGQRGTEAATQLIEQISEVNQHLLAIDNLVHARFEITSFSSAESLKRLMSQGMVQILSFMDHSPGQGQFKTLEKWKEYHVPVFELSDEEAGRVVASQSEKRERCIEYLQELAAYAREYRIIVASHDDDTPAKIDLMESLGVTIAEFPLCLETALYAKKKMMSTGMGAPNIVRGKSQSGNISARYLVQERSCDFLCSDYHPSSMLQAVYSLHRELGFGLAEALSYVSTTPAAIAGLSDRGEIAAGKLADVLVIDDKHLAKVVMTLKSGNPVYSGSGCLCIPALA
jgi:alpha-D-ribose 1-methylphosphonate 5-triphosphate diphosphatase